MTNSFPVFPTALFKATGDGQGATVVQVQVEDEEEWFTKSWRGFVDKTETKLVPDIVKLYNAVVYSSKGDLYMNR